MIKAEDAYKAHSQTVCRYLLSLTRDRELAEELTQETFYQAVRCADRFDGSCKVTTWLCAIAKNCLRKYRAKYPVCEEFIDSSSVSCSAESEVIEKESRVELFKAMQELTEDARNVMYLRMFGGLSFSEIGDILSRTENWARVTYYRGKEKLKKELKTDG